MEIRCFLTRKLESLHEWYSSCDFGNPETLANVRTDVNSIIQEACRKFKIKPFHIYVGVDKNNVLVFKNLGDNLQ